jgi:hypothetical protein
VMGILNKVGTTQWNYGFGANEKTHGRATEVRATQVVCIPLLIPQPDRYR